MSRTVVTVATGLALVLLAALAFGGPLTRQRTPVASTGAPAPFGVPALVDVRPGQELCAEHVLLSHRAAVAEMILDQGARAAPDLAVTVRTGTAASRPVAVRGGERGRHTIRAPITAPARDELGSLCLRNTGRVPARFVGTEEFRAGTALQTTVDGQAAKPDVALTFYEGETVSALSFLPRIIDYMEAFRGFLGHAWILWPLLVLVVAGVPPALLWVLWRALGERP